MGITQHRGCGIGGVDEVLLPMVAPVAIGIDSNNYPFILATLTKILRTLSKVKAISSPTLNLSMPLPEIIVSSQRRPVSMPATPTPAGRMPMAHGTTSECMEAGALFQALLILSLLAQSATYLLANKQPLM
jgi:hypothetical protein